MASYSTTTAAIALGVDRKRLENLLGRCRIQGTSRGRQGRARRLARNSLLAVAAVLRLQRELGIPASRAVELLADGLLPEPQVSPGNDVASGGLPAGGQTEGDGQRAVVQVSAGGGLRRGPFLLVIDVPQLERELAHALAEAVEMSPRPKRGRPRGTARRREG